MRWQIEVAPLPSTVDSLGKVVQGKLASLGITKVRAVRTARLYCVDGTLDRAGAERLASELFRDPVVESARVVEWESYRSDAAGTVSVFKRQGVMDPVEAGILRGAKRLGLAVEAAATGTRYALDGVPEEELRRIAEAALANLAIEDIQVGSDRFPPRKPPGRHATARREVPLRNATPPELEAISKAGGLSLTRLEMEAIQAHFRAAGREPTDIELESLAQTWSEHCKHKTFAGAVRYRGSPVSDLADGALVDNLLKATIKAATQTLARPFCLSVFHDNAGVIAFDGDVALCMKVETHNHPSAIEPYGGAGTGLGGVIRDILGTGKGARPIANLDVFCVGPLDLSAEAVPKGALHPRRVLRGIVEGVRDYGNQMGIPTVNGAILFDERWVGNPLVYCGTVGLLSVSCVEKKVSPGEAIVALGGRTGRDGIHGATFSSAELHEESETVDSGAVQIGNAIAEKKVLDVVLAARDRGLFTAITDCGAGGFSSAVGEMGADCGARVHLERAPLKYSGLSPTEIWISEAQERMVLSVPRDRVAAMLALAEAEDVEAVVLGEFTDAGKLELFFGGELVGEVPMGFLHDGVPRIVREASWSPPTAGPMPPLPTDLEATLLGLLAMPNVASKEWVIRQYDHEVQAGSVVKPLVGTRGHGPSDGAVVAPLLGRTTGFAVACGMNPWYGDLDPYAMAAAVIDEAVRNIVAVGGDPDHCAILDNFSWGNTSKPDRLGGLVRAAYGCRDAALALGTPFISGKDSLNNEYKVGETTIVIPPSLLVSAIARVEDVRRAVTMDLKAAGNALYAVGATGRDLGGSHLLMRLGSRGETPPRFDGARARATFRSLAGAIRNGLVRACHDLSEGGLGVALAEMVLAGELGATIDLDALPTSESDLSPCERLFSESLSRFVVEVEPTNAAAFEACLAAVPCARIGAVTAKPELVVRGAGAARPYVALSATALEAAWRPPLTLAMDGRVSGKGTNHA